MIFETASSNFGEHEKFEERIDFEVTFMAKSYRDGKLTIPAFANRRKRAPKSLLKRNENSAIYEGTVTAQIFSEENPKLRVIENTSGDSYKELYPGQKERIKSSLVCPVKDDTNALLGTLVVHCDRTGFFNASKSRYWEEILEIFATRLAFEKTRFDLAYSRKGETNVPVNWSAPF